MAKITSMSRKALPDKDFGLPNQRKYPVDTKARAANAKARATQERNKGNITKAQESKIDRKANKKLGEKGSRPRMKKK